jgi:alkylation response protein AidB-like acyl-CoA dehydrogenase
MKIELTSRQREDQGAFRAFVADRIAPRADEFDREQRIPIGLLREMAARGYLGSTLPEEFGGAGFDFVTLGLLHQELGRASASLSAVLTVHDMMAHAVNRWGNLSQRRQWLPRLAAGELLGAFAVTESGAGSDVRSVQCTADRKGDLFVLNGSKKWITAGQIADLFLVLAQYGAKPTAFVVPSNARGLSARPITGMIGFRGAMLAEITMRGCEVPAENLISRVNFGVETAIQTALDLGRYTVASSCVGLAEACLGCSMSYADSRKQFGSSLGQYQLIAQMISEMATRLEAARLLCWRAGYLKDASDPEDITSTLIAKYFASRAAMQTANDAVQIHGANGCSADFPVQRFMRDAKVMEIIEGSSQIQQVLIAQMIRRATHQFRQQPAVEAGLAVAAS